MRMFANSGRQEPVHTEEEQKVQLLLWVLKWLEHCHLIGPDGNGGVRNLTKSV